jgi:hypothetical protein
VLKQRTMAGNDAMDDDINEPVIDEFLQCNTVEELGRAWEKYEWHAKIAYQVGILCDSDYVEAIVMVPFSEKILEHAMNIVKKEHPGRTVVPGVLKRCVNSSEMQTE